MLQCSACRQRQHTVCIGFFSNKDPRLQQVLEVYKCERCMGGSYKIPAMEARKRHYLSVVYNDGVLKTEDLLRRFGNPLCTDLGP